MKKLAAIFLPILIAASAFAAQPRPQVARIVVEGDGSTAYGSGVLVSASGTNAVVMTNWHVVRPPRKGIRVRWASGRHSPGNVVAADSIWDLACVQVERPDAEPVVIANAAPRPGDRLTIAGYGAGPYLEQTGPLVGWMSPDDRDDYRLVELWATARLGDSGGGIFNDRGELVGVLFGVQNGRTVGPCCTRISEFLGEVGLEP